MMDIHPITLTGAAINLVPMTEAHIPELTVAGRDPDIWRWMVYGDVMTEDRMRWFVQELLKREAKGTDLCFTVIERATGRAIGCTRFMDIHRHDRWLEIGGTWFGPEFRRTAANTESKYLLLRHAFEVYGCIRVQLKTDVRNTRSQRAIERLGAVREGILRKHMVLPDGYIRDTVMYSIIDEEWPSVKARLEGFLGRER